MLSRVTKSRMLNVAGYAAWLCAILWLLIGQDCSAYTAFLAPSLWVLLVAAAVLLIGFVAATLTRPANMPERDGLRTKWIVLLLPLAFLVLVPCGEAGSFAFDQRSSGGMGPAGATLAFDDVPPTGPASGYVDAAPIEVTLADLYQDYRGLVGRRVAFIGMVNPRKDLPTGGILVFRFSITCCAADAQPIAVFVAGTGVSKLRKDTWVRVEGLLGHEILNGSAMPAVRDATVKKTRRPLRPYLD